MKKAFGIIAIVAMSMAININIAEANDHYIYTSSLSEEPGGWLSFGDPEVATATMPIGITSQGDQVYEVHTYWDCKGWSGSC